MTTIDFITQLFCPVDDELTQRGLNHKHSQGNLYPSDLDPQHILPFGTPSQVDAHVREVVEAMNSPEGGLMIYAEIQPTYPLANISALCEALEKYCLAGKESNGVSG